MLQIHGMIVVLSSCKKEEEREREEEDETHYLYNLLNTQHTVYNSDLLEKNQSFSVKESDEYVSWCDESCVEEWCVSSEFE